MTTPLPCPFCGSDDVGFWYERNLEKKSVQCFGCSAYGPSVAIPDYSESGESAAEELAITEWNKRA